MFSPRPPFAAVCASRTPAPALTPALTLKPAPAPAPTPRRPSRKYLSAVGLRSSGMTPSTELPHTVQSSWRGFLVTYEPLRPDLIAEVCGELGLPSRPNGYRWCIPAR